MTRPTPAPSRLAAPLLALSIAPSFACTGGGSDTGASASESAGATTMSASASESESVTITASTAATAATTGASASVSASESDTETDSGTDSDGEPPTYCGAIDVSLVLDPNAPIYDPASRAGLRDFFDNLALETGARVRILANAGTEFMLVSGCPGLDPALPILQWAEGGVIDPDAHANLECVLDAMTTYSSDIDDGDWMFSGLMFPILDLPGWPDPAASGLALLLGANDDNLGGMYSRPGMASEAYLRLVGAADRRRVAAFSFGDGDELETFALSFNERSRYADRDAQPFAEAIAAWTPEAIGACDDFDFVADLPDVEGCTRIDVLFVIDGSISMLDEQNALAGVGGEPPVFADFTDSLLAELTDVEDFHVGVVSSEPGVTRLTTHTHYPETPESPETACGLPDGQRWIVGPSPALAEQFACIGATRAGDDETTALNGADALTNPENAGFLRDDSLLFVVILTDEDTQDYNLATMSEIRQRYLDAVGGDLGRIIILAIAGDQGVFEMPKTKCFGLYGAAVPGRRLTSIVNSFRDRGHTQDLCGGSMVETFDGILGDVVSACAAIEPIP